MCDSVDEKQVRLVLPREMHARFRMASKQVNRSMSGMARELCEQFVRESEEERTAKERRWPR
jgi:hypothetical protein